MDGTLCMSRDPLLIWRASESDSNDELDGYSEPDWKTPASSGGNQTQGFREDRAGNHHQDRGVWNCRERFVPRSWWQTESQRDQRSKTCCQTRCSGRDHGSAQISRTQWGDLEWAGPDTEVVGGTRIRGKKQSRLCHQALTVTGRLPARCRRGWVGGVHDGCPSLAPCGGAVRISRSG